MVTPSCVYQGPMPDSRSPSLYQFAGFLGSGGARESLSGAAGPMGFTLEFASYPSAGSLLAEQANCNKISAAASQDLPPSSRPGINGVVFMHFSKNQRYASGFAGC